MKDDLMEQVIKAHKRSFQRAFETAVRTGTALVLEIDGKIIEATPPYRYELVPTEPAKKKPTTRQKRKKS